MANNDNNIVQRRPAETTGLAGGVSLLIMRLLGVKDPDTFVALGIVIGAVPATVTWIVTLVRRK